MLFNSTIFIFGFLPVVLAGFLALGRHPSLARLWLGLASIAFYGWWEISYILLLVGSIAGNYALGLVFIRDIATGARRQLVLGFGIAGNLALLGYFKYAGFLVSIANDLGGGFALPDILLPAGISFFTFQQIAYLVDTHRRLVRDPDFVNYVLFVSFFPQLIAGPIVHHAEMMPQFARQETYRPRADNFALGISIFVLGLFKKVVLGDVMASYADPLWISAANGAAPDALAAWLALLGFTVQVYFDFSAYSDMAVGLGRMFNIILPTNFTTPYKATSFIDLWRGWHITLTRFFRDYVYLQIGGNRKSKWRRLQAMMVVMLLSGVWHGAGWTYIVWGAMNGVFLVGNYLWRDLMRASRGAAWQEARAWALVCWAMTMLAWVLTLVFFRAADLATAFRVLEGLAGLHGLALPAQLHGWIARAVPGLVHALALSPESPLPTFTLLFGYLWLGLLWFVVLALPTALQWCEAHRPTLDFAKQWVGPTLIRAAWNPTPAHAIALGALGFLSVHVLLGSGAVAFVYFAF
ncbi:MAG: MBOAT family protein [Alphaproteobacteria bacterium]|nr:MBOAT family protein [Alphaproteobacteria bacterium]